jgi:LmbE family N-acetylglucosaminyl deacetylase
MYDKLMIVAHPDDEIIFGGASLLLESGWKVICVTNGDHPIRAQEFRQAMNAVNAYYEIWNYNDKRYGNFNESLPKQIKRSLQGTPFRKIVTHNRMGEYGHPQHKALSQIMMDLVEKNLFHFHRSSFVLSEDLWRRKLAVLRLYKSQMSVIKKLKSYLFFEGLKQVK